jgi:hypothetical protein
MRTKWLTASTVVVLTSQFWVAVAFAACSDDSFSDCMDKARESAQQVVTDPLNGAQHLRDAIDTTTTCISCGLKEVGNRVHDFNQSSPQGRNPGAAR